MGAIVGYAKKKAILMSTNPSQQTSKYERITILWADAHAGDGHWATLDEEDQDEHIVATCGYLIPPSEGGKPNHYTIAQSVSPDEFVDHVIHIPIGMMRSVTFLTPATKDLTM